MENAVEAVAVRNPEAKFLLIDSVLMDTKGTPYRLPNVRTIVFREEEGSFLAGALAGLVTQSQKIGFVGGMEVPLIKKFETGFRAGLMTTNPKAELLVNYTGTFNVVANGKQVGSDLLRKGVDIVFHAAGTDGMGVIQAAREAHAVNKSVFVIGVDSDQHHLAPEAVLTSVVKRMDLAVFKATQEVAQNKFTADDQVLGIKDQAIALAEFRNDFPNKEKITARIEELKQKIISGEIKVPSRLEELASFKAAL
jgi:basic membrane protein A